MANPVIEIGELTRIYTLGDVQVRALDGVSLTVRLGEFISIMGSSGSGKSTLMNILGCLDRPSGGRYVFEGVDIGRLDEPALARLRSERIGFVFQNFNLLARTSAIENVALPLYYAGTAPARRGERLDRARDLLRRMGLGEREANTPSQLSGGQQQRVAIARALVNGPGVLLADEPTGNLDSRTSHEIMETLRTLNRDQGVTVIVVTHEPDIAAFTDRVIVMRDGKIVSDTPTPHDHAATPATAAPAPATPSPAEAAPAVPSFAAFALMALAAAAQAIGRNKLRSALTMLGVFIGVAALIAMVAVGQGANLAVRRQIESLGTNLLVVIPGATTAAGVRSGFGSASTLTVADAQAIRREAPAVAQVGYMIRQTALVQYGNQNWTTIVIGLTSNYLGIANWQVAAGRSFTPGEESAGATVALIGDTVRRQLFRDYENPVGATILVKGVALRVAGVLAPKGQNSFGQDQDDILMLPFTTAERKVLGVATPSAAQQSAIAAQYPPPTNPYGLQPRLVGYVNMIFVQAAGAGLVQQAIGEVKATLNRRHNIKPGDTADFDVRNLSQIVQAAESSSRIMALLLAAVASISLLVGGIGIMNILLVSVTERTREIGLRMAIGARRLHVLLQFLAEAMFLSVTGGIAGILFGLIVSEGISLLAKWPTLLSPLAIVGGFAFSAAVGVFFGYYPARKASRLNPIEALRYE
jgi:macrolide transport system ATP-binding/permease protein